MRETSISEFLSNISLFTESSQNSNIILETVGTFGETIYTPYLVVSDYETIHPFFGECFIKSIVAIMPDIGSVFSELNKESIYAKMLNTSSPIGGSFAGEMYYNFGSLYPIMSALIGFLFEKLSKKINMLIKTKQFVYATLPIIILSLSLWWVRDSVGNLTRQIVWFVILIFIYGGFNNRQPMSSLNIRKR